MKWLWVLILIYIIIFGSLTSLRHYNFQTQTWDLGIFTQIMWNITEGNGPVGTLEFVRNHFAVHMSPFLFLLAPGFALFPSSYYLLIVQTIAIALGAWPLYLLAKKVLGVGNLPNLFAFLACPREARSGWCSLALSLRSSLARSWHQTRKKVSQLPHSPPLLTKERGQGGEVISFLPLAIALAYLLYPSLHWVNWFDFHPVAFLIPFFLAAFYFAETKQWKWMSLFLALAASTQEDAILVVVFFGIYMIFKKEYKIGLLVFILSTIYFILSIKLIMPYFGGGLLRLDRYDPAIFYSPALLLKTVFAAPKMLYLFNLFWPVAFLPLLAPREWILLIPGLAQNLLTNYAPQFAGAYQYDSVLIAGIFIAAVFGAKKANDVFAGLARGAGMVPPQAESAAAPPSVRLAGANWKSKKVICFLAAASILAFLLRSPIGLFNFPTELFKSDPRNDAFRKIISLVPPNASIAAHTNLVPHIAKRERVYMLGLEQEQPDMVIMDGADYFGFGTAEFFQKYAQNYADAGKYNMQILDDRYYILTRKR